MRPVALVLQALFAVAVATQGHAQSYPTKPVRLINPFSPGGAIDVVARNLAASLTETFGQQVLVENRLGASGNIAAEIVARSAPDGHTLLMAATPLATNPSLYASLPFDVQKDFAPISMVTAAPLILCVHPTIPAKTTRELIALVKRNPGEFQFPSAGNGSSMHLAAALFGMMSGIRAVHVPYKGSAPGIVDLVSGRLHFMFNPMPEPLQFIQSGKLRALATSGRGRVAALPDVPPVADAVPGYDVLTWHGIVAPALTPAPVINRLHTEVTRALANPQLAGRLRALALEIHGTTPDQFGLFIRDEIARWSKVIKATGARLD
jgi:tripartite-type tricarboxylate transporter receptor subunit TctC